MTKSELGTMHEIKRNKDIKLNYKSYLPIAVTPIFGSGSGQHPVASLRLKPR